MVCPDAGPSPGSFAILCGSQSYAHDLLIIVERSRVASWVSTAASSRMATGCCHAMGRWSAHASAVCCFMLKMLFASLSMSIIRSSHPGPARATYRKHSFGTAAFISRTVACKWWVQCKTDCWPAHQIRPIDTCANHSPRLGLVLPTCAQHRDKIGTTKPGTKKRHIKLYQSSPWRGNAGLLWRGMMQNRGTKLGETHV